MKTNNTLFIVLILALICICTFSLIQVRVRTVEPVTQTLFQSADSLRSLGEWYRDVNRAKLIKELFTYYVDSLERIGYSSDWACEKASVELGLKSVTAEYVAIEED